MMLTRMTWNRQSERIEKELTVLTASALEAARTLAQLGVVADTPAAVVARPDMTRSYKQISSSTIHTCAADNSRLAATSG